MTRPSLIAGHPSERILHLDASYWDGIRALLAGPWPGVAADIVSAYSGGRATVRRVR